MAWCVCVKACICAFSNHFGFIIFHTRVIPSLPFIASHNHVYFRCLQHTHTHFHNHANDNVFQTFKIYPNMLHRYICSILAHTPRNLYSVDVLSFCRFWLEKLCVYHNFCRLRLWSHGVRLWGERHTHGEPGTDSEHWSNIKIFIAPPKLCKRLLAWSLNAFHFIFIQTKNVCIFFSD